MTEHLSRLNFRDLGGIALLDGSRIRPGLLFRCEGPASFDERHRGELGLLGIKVVCDLRAAVERDAAPNSWSGSARLLEIDLNGDLRNRDAVGWDALADDATAAGGRAAMRANYATMPAALKPHLQGLVEALSDGETPIMIHCTAGKDRTGVLVAILLHLLGAPRSAIDRDYMRSDIFAQNARLNPSIEHAFEKTFGFRPAPATVDAITGVDIAYLQAAFDTIDREWGSVENYLVDAGISDALQAAAREHLVEPDHSDAQGLRSAS